MNGQKQYEILPSLPPYGPMYIPVSEGGEPFYSEGFVVRFFRKDGTNWVANFSPGWTQLNKVYDFPRQELIIVIAGGLGYVMNPESEKPVSTFGLTINEIFQVEDGSLVCTDSTSVLIVDNSTGEIWQSERISWDGFRNLVFKSNILSGQSYNPIDSMEEWVDFSLNIQTKEIMGGSYRETMQRNPHIPKVVLQNENKTRPWWKIW